jgi:hypothetical protein
MPSRAGIIFFVGFVVSEIVTSYDRMKRFSTPRKIPFTQLLLVTVLGVIGGVYVWKPVFESFAIKRYEKQISSDTVEARR